MADQSDDWKFILYFVGKDPEGEHELFDGIQPWRFEPQGPYLNLI